jgi:hypothetical protein
MTHQDSELTEASKWSAANEIEGMTFQFLLHKIHLKRNGFFLIGISRATSKAYSYQEIEYHTRW